MNCISKMKKAFCVLCALALILVSSIVITYTVAGKEKAVEIVATPLASDATINEMIGKVSQNAMYHTIYELQNFTTRYAYTTNCVQASVYIHDMFAALPGLQVSYDPFTQDTHDLRNVIAVYPGMNASNHRVYVISGHYDSYNGQSDPMTTAPGADDDATGVALVLEAARIFTQYRFESTIVFAAWSGEETGLVGSAHYANNASAHNIDVGAMLQFDMIGYDSSGQSKLSIDHFPSSTWLWQMMGAMNTQYSIGLTIGEMISFGRSDHVSFNDAGYSGIMCIETDLTPNYHTPQDTIDNIQSTLYLTTKSAKLGIATLGNLARVLTPTEGSVYLDKVAYLPSGVAGVTIYDSDMSGSFQVTVKSTTEPSGEQVTLSQVDQGIFSGQITLSPGTPTPGNSQLEVKNGDVIIAEYADTSPSLTSVAKARVDSSPPRVWGIGALPSVGSATICWSTDEPANSTVYYGKTATLSQKTEKLPLTTNHSLVLSGLDPATTYYFDIASADIVGNSITMDNGGSHYGFVTLTGIYSIPGYGFAYWVRENNGQNPNFDGVLHAGWGSSSHRFYSAIQFNLTGLPGGATITNASVKLYGHGWSNGEGSGDFWYLKMLDPAIDANFNTHTFPDIAGAAVDTGIPPVYPDTTLDRRIWTNFYYNTPQLVTSLSSHIPSGKVSFRAEGPTAGPTSHIFAWDAGHGANSYGEEFAPCLTIIFSTIGDTTGPAASALNIAPNPTDGKRFVNFTATLTDDLSNVVAAEWFIDNDPGIEKGFPASAASGGIINGKTVDTRTQIDAGSLPVGDHTIYIRGQDSAGNWGNAESVVLHVTALVVPEPVLVIIPGVLLCALAAVAAARRNAGRRDG